jgi:hypothetical protein
MYINSGRRTFLRVSLQSAVTFGEGARLRCDTPSSDPGALGPTRTRPWERKLFYRSCFKTRLKFENTNPRCQDLSGKNCLGKLPSIYAPKVTLTARDSVQALETRAPSEGVASHPRRTEAVKLGNVTERTSLNKTLSRMQNKRELENT